MICASYNNRPNECRGYDDELDYDEVSLLQQYFVVLVILTITLSIILLVKKNKIKFLKMPINDHPKEEDQVRDIQPGTEFSYQRPKIEERKQDHIVTD